MRTAMQLPLLITVMALMQACGSNNFAGENGNVQAPAKQEASKSGKDADTDKSNKDDRDTDDNLASLQEQTDECNSKGGILLNDSCNICPVGQTVDYVAQSCVALTGSSDSSPAGVTDAGSSIDVKGIMDVVGELVKNLPQDTGGGGVPPGGGGCG